MSEVTNPTPTAPEVSVPADTSSSIPPPERIPSPSEYAAGSTEAIAAAILNKDAAAETGIEEVPTQPEAPESDDIESIQGELTDSMGRKRENRIPYSKVQKILENARKKVQAEWEGKLKDHTDKLSAAEAEIRSMAQVAEIMQTNPDGFLQMLSQHNPAYSKFISASPKPDAPKASTDMPQPDIRLSDGTSTYSMEGLQQLMQWQAAQVEKQVSERYAPIEQYVGQLQEQQRQQTIHTQAAERVQKVIEDARSWPGFTDNESEILKELQSDPKISLDGAYRKVVFTKLQTDRNKLREDVLKEINSQPRTTSAPVTPSAATPHGGGPRTTEQVAWEALRKVEGQN
jgi:hypothetical protein